MRVTVSSQSLPVTQALRGFAHQQAEKLFKLNQRISSIQISLEKRVKTKTQRNAMVKYVVRLPGKTVVIKRKAHDMYVGIVEATDRAVRQVRKLKERNIHRSRRQRKQVLEFVYDND